MAKSYKEYRQLVEEQGQQLLDALAFAATGQLEEIEINIPEGVDVMTDLAIGISYLLDDMHGLLSEREEREHELERRVAERTQELEQALAEVQAIQRRYIQREWTAYTADAATSEELTIPAPFLPTVETAVANLQTTVQSNGKTNLVVPINYADELIGVLGFSADELRNWDEDEIAAVEAIAEQVGLALENQRLFDQTQTALAETEYQAQRLAQLNEMGTAFNAANSTDEVFQIAGTFTLKILDGARASVTLLDEGSETFEVLALSGEKGAIPTGMHLPVAKTAVGKAITENRLIRQPEDAALEDYLDSSKLAEQGIRSILCTPLVATGTVLGTLNIASTKENAFQASDVNLMRQVTTLLASTLESRNLFQQIQNRAAQLTKLTNIETALSQAQTPDEILAAVATTVAATASVILFDINLDKSGMPSTLRAVSQWQDGQIVPEESPIEMSLDSMISSRSWLQNPEQAFLVENLPIDPRLDERSRLVAKQAGIQAAAIISLRSAGAWQGILLFSWPEPHHFTEEERFLFQQLLDATAAVFARNKAEQAQQRALLETESLYTASGALNAAQSYAQILDVLRQHTIVGQGAQNVSLNFFDRAWLPTQIPIWIDVLARYSELPEGTVQERYRITAFPAATTLLKPDAPTVIEDVANDPAVDENARKLYVHGFKAVSTIFVPLVVGNSWIGYVNAIYQQPTRFTEDGIRRLMALGGQAAIAVQNVYAVAETQARAEELTLLNEMSQALASMLDPNEIIKSIYTFAEKLLDTTNFYVALHDLQRNVVSFPLAVENGELANWKERPFGAGMTEHLIKGKMPVLIEENVDKWQEQNGVASIGSGAQSWLGVPMISGNQAIGVIAAQNSESYVYNQNHLNLLSSIASQVTIAIQNARLFQQTRERARREQILRQITTRVRGSADVDTIMRTAVQEIGRTLGRKAVIYLDDDHGA
ncbi:MAG: GAF domain-containing protein [Anaerolineales bacterium]|nr:GAF domain-containing protein [Anaerolineales bacterium]